MARKHIVQTIFLHIYWILCMFPFSFFGAEGWWSKCC